MLALSWKLITLRSEPTDTELRWFVGEEPRDIAVWEKQLESNFLETAEVAYFAFLTVQWPWSRRNRQARIIVV